MRRLQIDRRGATTTESFRPTRHTNAPAIAWFQPWKAPLRMRGDEIVTIEHGKIEELFSNCDANRVQPAILGSGAAVAVAEKPGERIEAAALQLGPKDIRRHRTA